MLENYKKQFLNDNKSTLLYLIPIIALALILFNPTDNLKTIKSNESSVEAICKDAIVAYTGPERYSADDIIYLEQQKINATQENEIDVQFQDISSGKVITTVFIKNENRCDVVNPNSSHFY